MVKRAINIPGLKRIRCMHHPRYVYYDKLSKIRIYLDDGWSTGYCSNISWGIRGYPKDTINPQLSIEEIGDTGKTKMTLLQGLNFAQKVIRDHQIYKYTPEFTKDFVKNLKY